MPEQARSHKSVPRKRFPGTLFNFSRQSLLFLFTEIYLNKTDHRDSNDEQVNEPVIGFIVRLR